LAAMDETRASADAYAVAAAAGRSPVPAAVRTAARSVLDDAAQLDPPLRLDYLALVDPADFTEIPDDWTGEAVLAVAARVGTTRLIDNLPLTFAAFADPPPAAAHPGHRAPGRAPGPGHGGGPASAHGHGSGRPGVTGAAEAGTSRSATASAHTEQGAAGNDMEVQR
uniref:pantoate--beta-alanine ligase n=1 Tax=Streptomyces sp. YIM 98790 TaxID=2689077 RepID=UPI001A9F154E